jgi:hypothetical protein
MLFNTPMVGTRSTGGRKMRVIEGTVEEIVEYQRRSGALSGEVDAGVDEEPSEGGVDIPVAKKVGEGDDAEAWYEIEQHVYTRARTAKSKALVMDYLERVRELGTMVEIGESQKTHDGLTNYLMVRDEGPRRFGAVAYVKPAIGGLTLRLRADEVDDVLGDGDLVKLRQTREGHQYAVNCPLRSAESVAMAVKLTERALEKVRS